jgi:hypothetical protein
MPRRKRPRRTPGWMGGLTFLAIVLSIVFTLSYGSGAHIAVRYLDPPLGAWWNANEFSILACAAAALGILLGIRIGARLVGDRAVKNRSMVTAVIVGALALPLVARISAEAARFRFTSGASIASWLIDCFAYDVGMFLDKLLAASVYSIKIAAFSLPVGMILFGAAVAIFMTTEPVRETGGATSK